MSKEPNNNDKEKVEVTFGKPSKEETARNWIKSICLIAGTIIGAGGGGYLTYKITASLNVWQNQNQNQEQEQTQIVIDPREGDVIVFDGQNYKLIQLLDDKDVYFPNGIQEKQISHKYPGENRVDVNNTKGEDWSKKDSFKYTIEYFSLNANKMFNLLDYIKSIDLYLDFYEEEDVTTLIKFEDESSYFHKSIWKEDSNGKFSVSFNNLTNDIEYVTNEGLGKNGINHMKARLDIVYSINEKTVNHTILSNWLTINQDNSASA